MTIRNPKGKMLIDRRTALTGLGGVALTTGLGTSAWADTAGDLKTANEVVAEAVYTVEKMSRSKEFGAYVRAYMKTARAVIVFPQIIKGGFFVGGEGGTGVLLARGENDQWSYPAFFSMASGSFGLQFGGQVSEMMLLVMTGKGLDAILNNKVKVGGEINGAIGPFGAGAEASTTSNLNTDVLSYSISEGAFIGAAIEGAYIFPRDSLDTAFYNDSGANARSVVIDGQFANAAADPIRGELAKYQRDS